MKNVYLFIIFLFLFFYSLNLQGQNRAKTDSLRLVYQTAVQDTTKIKALDALAWEYASNGNDSAQYLAKEAVELAQISKEKSLIALTLNTLGYSFYTKRDYDQAILYYKQSLDIREKLNNNEDLIVTNVSIASCYFYQREYSNAILYFEKALHFAEKKTDLQKTANILNNIGLILQNKGDYSEALVYFVRSLKIKEELGEPNAIRFALNSISNVYLALGDVDNATSYAKKSLEISDKNNLVKGKAVALTTLASIYNAEKNYNESLMYYEKALVIYEELNDDRGLLRTFFNIAVVHKNLENYDRAMYYFHKVQVLNEKMKDKLVSIYAHEGLANLYMKKNNYDSAIISATQEFEEAKKIEQNDRIKIAADILFEANKKKGNYKEALLYYETANIIRDSLFNLEKSKAISNLTSTIELERKEKELAIVEKDNELNRIAAEKKEHELEIVRREAEAEHLIALAMQEKDKRKADSLLNLAQKNKMEAKNLQIQQEKQELAFKAEREEQKRIQYTYLAIAGTFLIVLVLIGIGLRQKQKANRKLASQNKEIKSQQQEIAQKNNFLNQANEELQQQHEELVVLHENLESQKQTIESTYIQLKSTTEQLDKSIQYASHIQTVVMPEEKELKQFFSDLFVLFRPRDVVSGDFYWFSQFSPNQAILALADCTGHGVPGAFMSMLGATLLHETVNIKKITDDPARILRNVHQAIRKILKQEQDKNNDGMDISLCIFKKTQEDTVELIFSGAKSTMSYISEGEIHHIKGDKQYLGGKELKQDFTNQHFVLPSSTIFYLYTDGYPDQNNLERKKIGSGKFRNLLVENATKDFESQLKKLEEFLDNHQKTAEQRDDISVIGIKL